MCVLENVHHKKTPEKLKTKKKFNIFTNNVLTFLVVDENWSEFMYYTCTAPCDPYNNKYQKFVHCFVYA